MSQHSQHARMTVRHLQQMAQEQQPIVVLTAYDASFARLIDQQAVDVILVGDSLGMVVQGQDSTVPVSVDDMIYHSKAVNRGRERALLMVDMPFMSYTDPSMALLTAKRLMQEGGAEMVKLEGGRKQLDTVAALAEHGVPVCAHIGLTPQSVHKLGGYRFQGRDEDSAQRMLDDAQALEQAGADAVLLECVPQELAAAIRDAVQVPVIGIGAGVACDGQVLVLHDVIGASYGRVPRFSKNFMSAAPDLAGAIRAYVDDVRARRFPSEEHVLF